MALPSDHVRRFYDRMGRLQDTQAFYEDAAIDELVAHSNFQNAHRVVEVGCGTGRLARRLLDRSLPTDATYLGVELSSRMARLSRDRLQPHSVRADVVVTDAVSAWPERAVGADRVIATYVFDLLGPDATAALLEHIAHSLTADGLLCAVSVTDGSRGAARATACWQPCGVTTRAWLAGAARSDSPTRSPTSDGTSATAAPSPPGRSRPRSSSAWHPSPERPRVPVRPSAPSTKVADVLNSPTGPSRLDGHAGPPRCGAEGWSSDPGRRCRAPVGWLQVTTKTGPTSAAAGAWIVRGEREYG